MNPLVSEQLFKLWNDALSLPTMRFAEALPRLLQLGVQRYHVDYVAKTITAYVANEAYVTPLSFPPIEGEHQWNIEKILEGGKLIEEEKISYFEYSRRVINEGLTDYCVYITGQRVVFLGALGESHVLGFSGEAK
jgi:hypothetical protein